MTPKNLLDESAEPLTPSFLKRIESAAIDKLSDLLGMPSRPESERLYQLSPEQEAHLRQVECRAIADFKGDLAKLESALGMLRMGHHFGWQVLYMIHSKQTIRAYEEILKIKVREVFDATGPSSYRSVGLNLANRFSNFWKVAGGTIKIPRRKDAVSQ